MPKVREIRSAYNDFISDYKSTLKAVSTVREGVQISQNNSAELFGQAMNALHNNLDPAALNRLQRVLSASSIQIDLAQNIRTAQEKLELGKRQMAESLEKYGSDEYLSQKYGAAREAIHRTGKAARDALIQWVSQEIKFEPYFKYNKFAQENGQPVANAHNINSFARSIFWETFNQFGKPEEVELSRFIRSLPKHSRQSEVEQLEKAFTHWEIAAHNKLEAEKSLEELDGAIALRRSVKGDIISDEDLQSKINQSLILPLSKNEGFRKRFAEHYGDQAHDALLHHARYIALAQILAPLEQQASNIEDGITQLEKGLKSLSRLSDYKELDINLSSAEDAMIEGLAKIQILAKDMENRHKRADEYRPSTDAQADPALHFNYMILYMYVLNTPPESADLSSAASVQDIDMADLDMALYNPVQNALADFSIPDVSETIDTVTSSVYTSTDYGHSNTYETNSTTYDSSAPSGDF